MLGIVGESSKRRGAPYWLMIFEHVMRKIVNFKCMWRGKAYKIRQWPLFDKHNISM